MQTAHHRRDDLTRDERGVFVLCGEETPGVPLRLSLESGVPKSFMLRTYGRGSGADGPMKNRGEHPAGM